MSHGANAFAGKARGAHFPCGKVIAHHLAKQGQVVAKQALKHTPWELRKGGVARRKNRIGRAVAQHIGESTRRHRAREFMETAVFNVTTMSFIGIFFAAVANRGLGSRTVAARLTLRRCALGAMRF